MKKIIVSTAILLIVTSFSFTANAWWWDSDGHTGHGEYEAHDHHKRTNHDVKPVGAPLDGGILSILGAAGLAYYVSRKKKKSE